MPNTLFEKIWSAHRVAEGPGGQTLLGIDRHLLHEGSVHAFERLARAGRTVRRPDACFATADHYVPTSDRAGMIAPDETTFAYLEGRPYAPAGDRKSVV